METKKINVSYYMRVIRRYVDSNIGEALVDEHTAHYENPLKFSGKELDEITGLYDHGARNRNPVSTLWYGIDPLFEKYPEFSPYNYCAGNPVKLVDLDGRAASNLMPQTYQASSTESKVEISNPDYINNKAIKSEETDYIMYEAVINDCKYQEDAAYHVTLHGNNEPGHEGEALIYEDFPRFSSSFLESKIGKQYDKLVIHACYAGRGGNSYAANFSKDNPDIYVIAPNNSTTFFLGYNDCNIVDATEYVSDEGENKGMWIIFKGGRQVASFDGSIYPLSQNIDKSLQENGIKE